MPILREKLAALRPFEAKTDQDFLSALGPTSDTFLYRNGSRLLAWEEGDYRISLLFTVDQRFRAVAWEVDGESSGPPARRNREIGQTVRRIVLLIAVAALFFLFLCWIRPPWVAYRSPATPSSAGISSQTDPAHEENVKRILAASLIQGQKRNTLGQMKYGRDYPDLTPDEKAKVDDELQKDPFR